MIDHDFSRAALVVAHPDDEILWFSSVIDEVASVHICYLDVPGREDWTQGRRLAQERFPLPNTHFVGLTESVAFQCADWAEPQPSEHGLQLSRAERALPGFNAQRYADNFASLQRYLRETLQVGQTVLTHNPWGEYGHEEHVQVYRAVLSLQQELKLDVWHSAYASDRSANLFARTLASQSFEYISRRTNLERAHALEALYRETDCWTWPFDDYAWFDREYLFRPTGGNTSGAALPINFVNVDNAQLARTFNQPKVRLMHQIINRLKGR